MTTKLKVLVAVGIASALLGGCAVYGPPSAYATAPYSYYPPASVYVQPAPVYVAPPVSLGFGFGYWGGHGRGYHHH